MNFRIPFFSLTRQHKSLEAELERAIKRVFRSGVFIGGLEVAAFENEFAAWLGVKNAVSVACGFDALEIALRALGIGRGDEVIITANGCPASALAIIAAGAKPKFVDCNDDMVMAPESVERAITRATKAIMPVHLYGMPVDMDSIMDIARRNKLMVVEDCAQAHGAAWSGKKTGTFGHFACFSFYPTKNLGAAGDAGMIVTNDNNLAKKAKKIATYGEARRFDSHIPGVNSRLDPIQAAILRAKLIKLDSFLEKRRTLAAKYRETLGNSSLRLPQDPPKGKHAYHLFVLRTQKREKLRKKLAMNGIGSDVHYPIPFHLMKVFRDLGHKCGDFPNAERAANTVLSIPLYPEMTNREINTVSRLILSNL